MNENLLRLMAIGAGGAAGAVARHAVGVGCAALWGDRFGYGTLLVNVVGCFALGVIMHEAWTIEQRNHLHSGLAVGLLGGLTTFSTFGYQTIRHLEEGEPVMALMNVALNLLLGLAAAASGLAAARALWPTAA